MATYQFDKVIIGAGLAGLCCAGELVRHGERPLLISETKEVGANFARKAVGDEAFGIAQLPTMFTVRSGGGWWLELVRALNIPVRLFPGLGDLALTIRGSGESRFIPMCPTASGLTEMITEAFPFPMTESGIKTFERLVHAALVIPPLELMQLDQVPLASWLDEQGADETVSYILLTLLGLPNEKLSFEQARERLSTFGGVMSLRAFFCGDARYPMAYPDIRHGICVPIADEIERRGGTVWKGRKVQRVVVADGKAIGVVMEDGTEVDAGLVAIATGNPRIPKLLDPLPPEVEAPLYYSSQMPLRDFTVYTLLDKPVVDGNVSYGVLLLESMEAHWSLPLHTIAPWLTAPGKQLMLSHRGVSTKRLEEMGGEDALQDEIVAVDEELYPGFKKATVAQATQTHPHLWLSPISVGPKLTRTIESVQGLWFVGDGSVPCPGIWGEAAASCGVVGARQMLNLPLGWPWK